MCATLLIAAGARAEPPEYSALPPLTPPPSATVKPPGEHHHDGFFLRITAGVSYLRDAYEASSGSALVDVNGSGTVTGFGQAHELSIGGAVAPGLILAGAYAADIARTTKTQSDGTPANADNAYVLATIGPMVDFYPNPGGGLHFELGVGFGVSSGVQPEGFDGGAGTGVGVFVGGGYEWWVAPQWGLGGLLRLHGLSTREQHALIFDELVVDHRAIALSLMFAATYN